MAATVTVAEHAPRVPAFRADIVDMGLVEGRRILGDPLIGSYFACGPVEDAVRMSLDGALSLPVLQERVRERTGSRVPIDGLAEIVASFRANRVLEPALADVADPEALRTIASGALDYLERRAPDRSRISRDDLDVDALWEAALQAEEGGGSLVEGLTRALAPTALLESRADLEHALRLAWLRHEYRRQPRQWLRILCLRIRLIRGRIPWVRRLAFLASGPALLGMAAVWLLALVTASGVVTDPSFSLREAIRNARLLELLIAVPIVLLLHELAHAVTCSRFGGEIREAGVFVFFGNVIPYVDVSDSWAFPRRRRLLVSAAGSFSDLTVAAACLLILAFVPDLPSSADGVLRVACSLGLLSLAVNLNPLFRFDGYFMLSDLLRVPNLRAKSLRFFAQWVRGRAGELEVSARERWLFLCYALAILAMVGVWLGLLAVSALRA